MLVNHKKVEDGLDALTQVQRSAFVLILVDHSLALLQPLDRERSRRMSSAMASSHLFLPRLEPFLVQWWKRLLGLPEEGEPVASANVSMRQSASGNSLGHRYVAFHMSDDVLLPGDSPDLYLQRLAMTSNNDPVVYATILVMEIAGSIAVDVAVTDMSGGGIVHTIDYALIELYEAAGAIDQLERDLARCLALAAGFDGTLGSAREVRTRAREAGLKAFCEPA